MHQSSETKLSVRRSVTNFLRNTFKKEAKEQKEPSFRKLTEEFQFFIKIRFPPSQQIGKLKLKLKFKQLKANKKEKNVTKKPLNILLPHKLINYNEQQCSGLNFSSDQGDPIVTPSLYHIYEIIKSSSEQSSTVSEAPKDSDDDFKFQIKHLLAEMTKKTEDDARFDEKRNALLNTGEGNKSKNLSTISEVKTKIGSDISVKALKKVFSYMFRNQHFRALSSCYQVSREWHSLVKNACEKGSNIRKLIIDENFFIKNPIVAASSTKKRQQPLGQLPRVEKNVIEKVMEVHKTFSKFDNDEKIKLFFDRILPQNVLKYVDRDRITHFEIDYRFTTASFEEEYLKFFSTHFTNLCFLNMSKLRTDKLYSKMLHYYGWQLIELNLAGSYLNDLIIVDILESCPKLETIDLRGSAFGGAWLNQIKNENSCINSITFTLNIENGYQHIHSNVDSNVDKYNQQHDCLINLLKRYKKLKCLKLFTTDTPDYDRNDELMTVLNKTESSLSELKVSIQHKPTKPNIKIVNFLELRKLDLSSSIFIETIDSTVSHLLNTCRHLKVLKLNCCNRVTDLAFNSKKIECELEELHLADLADLTYKTIETLKSSSSKDSLRVLNLDDFKFESTDQVLGLIRGFPLLLSIQLPFDMLFDHKSAVLTELLKSKDRFLRLHVQEKNTSMVNSFFAKREVSLFHKEVRCQNLQFLFYNMYDY